jgi:hypothetical protein
MNRNAQYIYEVDGETVWEKLRVIRGMLQSRKNALAIANLSREDFLSRTDTDTIAYKKDLVGIPDLENNIKDCENEIEFLTEFESYLSKEAEKTRIPGKTDDEMYEINFYLELQTRLVRRAQAQIVSLGRIEVETLQRILKNPSALKVCIDTGLLTDEVFKLTDEKLLPTSDFSVKYLEQRKDD